MLSFRLLFGWSILSFFVIFFLVSGLKQQAQDTINALVSSKQPDFAQYRQLRTLEIDQFPLNDDHRRVLVVGDIHGRHTEFQTLLSKLSYDVSTDVLVSVGDIVAKGPLNGSLAVLSWMTAHNVTAVRGNHDQKVIEWRSWINWIHSLPSGKRWLRNLYAHFLDSLNALPPGKEIDVDNWVEKEKKKDRRRRNSNTKWWDKIPDGWKLFGDHYLIASRMTDAEYQYLLQRPLVLHIPHAHAYIAHAGVLASDPTRDTHDKHQPLARIPDLPSSKESLLRKMQEIAVLNDVPQNRNPWVTLNMRSVLKKGEVTRGKDGTPWSELYNKDMSLCKGFDSFSKPRKDALPCHPATVIYGHAASRGLDIKRWTIGLDSGCVYDRRMSALILGGGPSLSDSDEDPEFGAFDIDGKRVRSTIPFGDKGKGKIVSVSCK